VTTKNSCQKIGENLCLGGRRGGLTQACAGTEDTTKSVTPGQFDARPVVIFPAADLL